MSHAIPTLGIIAEDTPDAVPVVFAATSFQFFDVIIATFVFFIAALQQNELDKSAHRLAVVALLVGCAVLFSLVQERIKSLTAANGYRRVWLAQYLCKVLVWAISFLTGVLARILADQAANGPMRGHFSLMRLVVPMVVVMSITVFLFTLNMLGSHRMDILRAMRVS